MSSISPVSAAPSPYAQAATQVARPTAPAAPPQAAVDPDHDGDHDTPGQIDVKA
jgi:hypothetical protein